MWVHVNESKLRRKVLLGKHLPPLVQNKSSFPGPKLGNLTEMNLPIIFLGTLSTRARKVAAERSCRDVHVAMLYAQFDQVSRNLCHFF